MTSFLQSADGLQNQALFPPEKGSIHFIHKQLTALPTKCRTNASQDLEEDDDDVDGVRGVE